MGCAASRSTDIYALGTLMWEVSQQLREMHRGWTGPCCAVLPNLANSLIHVVSCTASDFKYIYICVSTCLSVCVCICVCVCVQVLSNQRPWDEYGEADRLADVRTGETLDPQALPLDTPSPVKNVLESCWALDRVERPTVERVLGVLQEAHGDLLAETFDVFLSYAWGDRDYRKPLADKLYTSLQDAG